MNYNPSGKSRFIAVAAGEIEDRNPTMKSFAPLLIGYLLFNLTLGNSEAANPFNPPNFPLPQFKETKINVKDCGAMGNGTTEDTAAINQAIEKCSTRGGGDVVFPAGKYEAASIHIKSNVRLVLDPEAVITGVKSGCDPSEPNAFDKYQDVGHSHFHNSLFWGEHREFCHRWRKNQWSEPHSDGSQQAHRWRQGHCHPGR